MKNEKTDLMELDKDSKDILNEVQKQYDDYLDIVRIDVVEVLKFSSYNTITTFESPKHDISFPVGLSIL